MRWVRRKPWHSAPAPVHVSRSPRDPRRRRHRLPLPAFATALVTSLALATPAAHAAACPGANQLPLLSAPASAKAATLCLLNNERAAQGLAPLTSQPILEAVAATYAGSMVGQQFFAHVSPAGQTMDQRLAPYVTGTSSYGFGENLAWGQGALGTPTATMRAWMASPGHRDNILNSDFQEIGLGIVRGLPVGGLVNVGWTYATEFGSRKAAGAPTATRASAASVTVNWSPTKAKKTKRKAKRISAKTKRRISTQCHRVARRTKASAKTRRARYDRCVRTKTRAAQKSAARKAAARKAAARKAAARKAAARKAAARKARR